MAAEFRLGVQSYCFRNSKTLAELISCLQEVSLEYVEIYPGHQPFEAERAEVQKMLDALGAEGITMDSYGAIHMKADEKQNRTFLEFCNQTGIKSATVVDVDPDAYEMVDRLCEEYDVNVALHNHGRRHRLGAYSAIEEVLKVTSKRFGVCLDTAWALDSREDPVAGVDRFGDRLYGVHLKDFTFDEEGRPEDVIVGTGGLDLPAFLKRLQSSGFSGYFSLEYEGNPDHPLPDVKECVQVVKAAIAEL